jgi:hypothetical protein
MLYLTHKVKSSTDIAQRSSMKKIILTASLLTVCLGFCAMPRPVHGMEQASLATLQQQALDIGKKLFTQADNLVVTLAKDHPNLVFIGGGILLISGACVALKGLTEKLPQIIGGTVLAATGIWMFKSTLKK